MYPNIKEIARRANVSIATVSRVLSGKDNVSDETKRHVQKIAKQLDYKPNLLARNFVKGKSNIIGLILPDISDEFFSEIIKSVDDTSYQNGYFTMVISSHGNRSLVESINTMMYNGIVGGFILLVPFLNAEIKKSLSMGKIPFVLICGNSNIKDFDVVTIDNFSAAQNAVNFLVQRGYKKIAHITGPKNNYDTELRYEGFVAACKKMNIKVKPSWVVQGDFTLESGEKAATQLLSQQEKPQAIFAANDMMAVGCYNSIIKMGLKIPEDIAIIGFDDVLITQYLTPPLTTIKVDTEAYGKIATERLIQKMNGINNLESNVIQVSTELIIRNSC